MFELRNWAIKHHVGKDALLELHTILTATPDIPTAITGTSEAAAQVAVRTSASSRGWRLFRNNIGAGKMDSGSFVRFGLANDSAQLNAVVKSGDLIGIRSVLITPDMVGSKIGQFVSIEVKKPGWRYSGAGRETAQMAWIKIVVGLGGYACFSTGGV